MKITRSNINTQDKREVYRLTKGESQKIDGLEKGISLPVEKWALYEESKTRKKQDGTEEEYTQTVLTFVSGGYKFGTISATFIKSFLEIVDLMENEPFAIVITGGESKNGRRYVNCEMDCDWSAEA